MKRSTIPILMALLSLLLFSTITCKKDNDEKANLLPNCTITTPSNESEVVIGKTVSIAVEASDIDGTVEEVCIIINDIERSRITSFPFNYIWNTSGENPGNYTIKATAIDDDEGEKSDMISFILLEEVVIGDTCPDSISWQGQIYHTVLIGNQCWIKENINWETGNSWCYNDDPANCDTYGRLYDWMTARRVCPTADGWHLPSDIEWKILEGFVDSQYPSNDAEWDVTGYRGFDAGKNLKSSFGWSNSGNGEDSFGFTALPGGRRSSIALYRYLKTCGRWWTAIPHSEGTAVARYLFAETDQVYRYNSLKSYGHSVRCLKD